MELRTILDTLVIRFVDADTDESAKASPPPLVFVRTIQDRYNFLQVPRTIEEYNFSNGITFLGGSFEDTAIDRVQIYEKGVVCSAKAKSDVCDRLLDDLLRLITNNWNVQFTPKSNLYRSQLEVKSELDIGEAFPRLSTLGDKLSSYLNDYGHSQLKFAASGFKMQSEGFPAEFSFERRAEVPYDQLIYYTSAPLNTAEHLAFLELFEKFLACPTDAA